MLVGDGGADLAATTRIINEWISEIQSSLAGDERSSVCLLCQKQHDLWECE